MRRSAVLLLLVPFGLGHGSASSDRGGRVVRIEAPRRIDVPVPAGKFWMGVQPIAAQAAFDQCSHIFPRLSGTTPAGVRVDFCEDYLEDLAHMEPREVYLHPYSIDRDEVAVAAYRACVVAGACDLDPLVAGDERYIRDEWPMVNVTWTEAQQFCRWRGGRLPTEAEWERAARGDDPTAIWPWGEFVRPGDFNHGRPRARALREIERSPSQVPTQFFGDPDDSDRVALLAAPGSYVWGEGPFGTRDQAGNVAEWTADAFVAIKGYSGLPSVNPLREPTMPNQPRIVRGGSWRQPVFVAQANLRDPFASIYDANRRFSHVGFRCAYSNAHRRSGPARPAQSWPD